jgi:hypothetical protein
MMVACSTDPSSYENLSKEEKSSIANYIARNNIKVISKVPTNNIWAENEYLRTSNGLYIHIVDTGNALPDTVVSGQLVISRYRKISLDAEPDTVKSFWTTAESPYPYEFSYNVSGEAFTGFQEAVSIMKRNNSVAKIIVPSKIGTSDDLDAVKAYAYDFKFILGD